MSMQPLPPALIEALVGQFPALYSQEHTPNPLVLAHFYSSANGWDWYLWEGSPVDGDGYFDTQLYGFLTSATTGLPDLVTNTVRFPFQ